MQQPAKAGILATGISPKRKARAALIRAALIERLESRTLLSAAPIRPVSAIPPAGDSGQSNNQPATKHPLTTFVISSQNDPLSPPFTPAEIRTAYQMSNLSFGGVTGNGAGQTIALIDAYNDPDIVADANTFGSTYGLPQFTVAGDGPTLTVENQNGSTSGLPANSTAGVWDVEESLDVEWAHTVAPQANIILFEGNAYSTDSQFIANETTAVNTAKNTKGVSVVSMSFGVSTYSGETAVDSTFTTPSNHQGVTFFASSGDSGTPNGYPSDSPDVVAVGGTSLTINGDGSDGGETGWYGSGGGISSFEPQPVSQSSQGSPFSKTHRTTPDVAWLADPNTGVAVLDTFYTRGAFQVGGTSLASPMWAAMTSIADQGRALNGLNSLDGPTQTLPLLYSLPSGDFHDETVGNNGYSAGPGYDLVTGIGSPNVPSIVSDMAQATFAYVDGSAVGGAQNGSSWVNAYTSFQPVMTGAPATREIVLVAQGAYLPGANVSSTFQLQDNTAIFGSFAGNSAADPDSSAAAFPSILSGNLGPSTNSASVVTGSGTNSTAMLEGFNIENGAGGAGGGGLFDSSGSPVIGDCTFSADSASSGGAVYNLQSSPTLIDCTFTGDSATNGGALYNDVGSSPALSQCSFAGDSATASGGAVYAEASPTLTNCLFNNNTADISGGALFDDAASNPNLADCSFQLNTAPNGGAGFNNAASPTFAGCTFTSNSVSAGGGALNNSAGSAPNLINCTFESNAAAVEGGAIANVASAGNLDGCLFVGNSAPLGGALSDDSSASPAIDNCTFTANTAYANGAALYDVNSSSPVVSNSIFWLDVGSEIFNADPGSLPVLSYTDISGGNAGIANLNTDPLFLANANPGAANFGNLELQQLSPCINAGLNGDLPAALTTDVAGHPRIIGGTVDLGAYEATYVYVDAAATGAGNGGNWANAFPSLATALNSSTFYGEQLDMSGGMYKPTATTNRFYSFDVPDGVSIYGGYEGLAGAAPFTRSTSLYPTVLSGDIGVVGASTDNSYTVLQFDGGADSTTALDGVTVTGGSGDSTGYTEGAGIYIQGGSPTINNCVITANTDNGGSVYEALGAGVLVYKGNPAFTNCTISNNSAQGAANGGFGGGLFIEDAAVTMINCAVTGGAATDGAGIYSYNALLSLTNCLVSSDSASYGGGLLNAYSIVDVDNCTFTRDSALYGGALYDDFALAANVTNSVLYGNTANYSGSEDYNYFSTLSVKYSDISGGFGGTGNINANPLFISAANFQLQPTSPCINDGSNAAIPAGVSTDPAGNSRIVDGVVDMGAYECQNPSITWTGLGDGKSWSNPNNWSDKLLPTRNDTVAIPGGFTVIQVGGGTFAAGALTTSSPLEILSSGTLQLFASAVLNSALTIDNGGTLDIQSNTLAMNYAAGADPAATMRGYLKSAYSGGLWSGTGLTSSTVEAQVAGAIKNPGSGVYAIGYLDGAVDVGQSLVTGNQLVFQPTIVGDTDLNGNTNFLDLGRVAQNLGAINADWYHGDFNYDGSVNFLDVGLLAQNLNKTTINTPVSANVPAAKVAAVIPPKPATETNLYVAGDNTLAGVWTASAPAPTAGVLFADGKSANVLD